jgi:hypothetical protein
MNFYDIVEKFGETIDGAGVIVVIVGALIAFAGAVIGLTRHEADVYRRLRERLGRTILLGLELLVAGDIVRTVAAQTHAYKRRGPRRDRAHPHIPEPLAGSRNHRSLALAKAHRINDLTTCARQARS